MIPVEFYVKPAVLNTIEAPLVTASARSEAVRRQYYIPNPNKPGRRKGRIFVGLYRL